ncbi:MAG: methyltransferase domain-containing protein, partial [bacterium]
MNCPLCSSDKTSKHFNRNNTDYFLCSNCDLVFMDHKKHMNDEEKKLRYYKHKNNISDLGYKSFLMELAVPSFKLIDKDKKCLDYGCGPTKAMEQIFRDNGFEMYSYDPCFFPEIEKEEYNLITCNEVIEHFSNPKEELKKLFKLIKKDGFAV